MKTLEKNLWGWLKRGTSAVKKLDIERVENSLCRGTPDVDGTYCGRSFKLELKTAARPKRPETPVRFKFQPGQVNWLIKRWAVGGPVFLLCQVGSGAKANRFLIPGSRASEVKRGVPEQELHKMALCDPTASAIAIILVACR